MQALRSGANGSQITLEIGRRMCQNISRGDEQGNLTFNGNFQLCMGNSSNLYNLSSDSLHTKSNSQKPSKHHAEVDCYALFFSVAASDFSLFGREIALTEADSFD